MKGRPYKTVPSNRDKQLLTMIFSGYSHKDIAAEECCTAKSIGNALHRVYKLLDVSSAPHAIYKAIQLGYITAPKVLPEVSEKRAALKEAKINSLRELNRQAELEFGVKAPTFPYSPGKLKSPMMQRLVAGRL